MSEEWIVRVQGKEYGPVDLDELLVWKAEGRLIRENEVRAAGSDRWIPAGELPEIFADRAVPPPLPPTTAPATVSGLVAQSWRIYCRGFAQFFGLTALVIVPSVCAQLSATAAGSPSDVSLDARSVLAGLFNLCMLVLNLIAWPIYLAGIQILTVELAQGRLPSLRETVSRAAAFWPRIAGICILVYGAFVLLIAFAFAILLMVAMGTSAPILVPIALGLLALQIWMFGRVFAATLFWQQTAVLDNFGAAESLRKSNEVAHSRRDLSRFRRPLWKGAMLASIWCVLATALTIGPDWHTLTEYFNAISTTQDPQALMQAMTVHAQATRLHLLPLLLGVVQAILRPLLGIAFVLLYLDVTAQRRARNTGTLRD